MREAKFHLTQDTKLETPNSKAGTLFRRKDFTLIELLIVIAIIGIIAGLVIPTYQSSVRKAQRSLSGQHSQRHQSRAGEVYR